MIRQKSENFLIKRAFFLEGSSVDLFYLCGLFAADGHVRECLQEGRVYHRGGFTTSDRDFSLLIAEWMDLSVVERVTPPTRIQRKPGVRYDLEFTDSYTGDWFWKRFGSHKSKVCETFISEPLEENRAAFLTGYLDGDGCVSRTPWGPRITFCFSVNEPQLKTLICSYLERLKVHYWEGRIQKNTIPLGVTARQDVLKLKNCLYKGSIALDRKKSLLQEACLSSRFVTFSREQKQEILLEIRYKLRYGRFDFDFFIEKYGLALNTLQRWVREIKLGYN